MEMIVTGVHMRVHVGVCVIEDNERQREMMLIQL